MDMELRYRNLKEYFHSGATLDIEKRRQLLISLKRVIKAYEPAILAALKEDLGKSEFEAYATEIGMVYQELNYMIRHIHSFAKAKRMWGGMVNFPAIQYLYRDPYGVVLIIAPWNYPFQLSILPLIGAIAAGNVVALKPSEHAPCTASVISAIIEKVFSSSCVQVFTGGVEVSQTLLSYSFDYIFFTGSTSIGKTVMKAASEHLTPVTLELGGKSPCLIEESADLKQAAKRIIWGKFINAGQTCIAPDYVLVPKALKASFLAYLNQSILQMYGKETLANEEYPRIINENHFKRLIALMNNESIACGGKSDLNALKIEPTIIDDVTWDAPIMQEEIFGPLLPIVTYDNWNDTIERLKQKSKPLAFYLFTKNKKLEQMCMKELSFGGGCVNDTLTHIMNERMPFGGVGDSGIGQYHGKYSFDTFTHEKSVLKKYGSKDLDFRYPPYRNKFNILKKIMK